MAEFNGYGGGDVSGRLAYFELKSEKREMVLDLCDRLDDANKSFAVEEFNELCDKMKPHDAFETMRVRLVTSSLSSKLQWLVSELNLISEGDEQVAELCDSDCTLDQISTLVELLKLQPEETNYMDGKL
jgi:proline dehydrogenase